MAEAPPANTVHRDLPAGTVTILFTDIQGSTELLKQLGDDGYIALVSEHHRLMREVIDQRLGTEVRTQGDSFFVTFPRAPDAVAAAVDIQLALKGHRWPDGVEVLVRMGLHTGQPWVAVDDYEGIDIHRAARIASTGHGGQVLLSETTASLVRDDLPEGVSLKDLGLHRLKDMRRPEQISQLVITGLPADFPPIKSLESVPTVARFQSLRGYELHQQLGAGVFGEVFLAYQPTVRRDVAIKTIVPKYANDPNFIRRFEAEAQVVASLEHPHIVPLYDYWREPDGAYLVMRYLRGGSLEDALSYGPWQGDYAAKLVDQVAAGLAYAHRQGVVHRDIKPANILLDEGGNAYLSDFGIATLAGSLQAQLETQVENEEERALYSGSLGYQSPETADGAPATQLSDIYSLGVVLYQLVTARLPFPDLTGKAMLEAHRTQPLPSVVEVRPDIPAAVDGVIQKATAKDPAQRYPDAQQLAAAFKGAILAGEVEIAFEMPLEVENPYKGLRAFQEADAGEFFGRAAMIERLVGRLDASNGSPSRGRFLAVVGPSGSGKSSVVRAGLVPALRKGTVEDSDCWFILDMIPGAHPYEELEAALLRVAVNPPASLLEQLQSDERGLVRAVKRCLPPDEAVELLLVVDQFEELFTLVQEPDESRRFLDCLYAAVIDPASRVRVVITLRADFYDRPLMHPDFSELVQEHTEVVVPLTSEELSEAVRNPASSVGAVLEPGLTSRIVTDVHGEPGALPLLQYALTELFENRSNGTLTQDAYQEIGGVLGALGSRAEALYQELDDPAQSTARQLFLRLVTLGEGTVDTRRRVLRSELEALGAAETSSDVSAGNPATAEDWSTSVDQVIGLFGGHRLLTFDRDPTTREPTVEVAHEALLGEWNRLRGWLDESRADVRMQRVLGNAAAEWVAAERDPSFLLRGSRLEQYQGWAASTDLALTADERAYLEASTSERKARQAAEAERLAKETALERRSRNVLRALVAVFAVAAVVAVVLSLFAFNAQRNAEQQATIAQARELSQAAALNVENDPELTILLSQEAINAWQAAEQGIPRDLEETLRKAVQNTRQLQTWTVDGTALDIGFNHETGNPYLILTDQDLSFVRIWDPIQDRDLFRLEDANITSETVKADLSADGSLIAIPHADNIARVYEVASGKLAFEMPAETNNLLGTNFSPDGRLLGIYGENYQGIWDLGTGELAIPPYADPIVDLLSFHFSFNNDGSRVVWPSESNTFKVIDTGTGDVIAELTSDLNVNAMSVAISPDGNRVAGTGLGGPIQVWDLSEGESSKPNTLWHDAVGQYSMMFNFPGDKLAYAMQNGVLIWDLNRDKAYLNLYGRMELIRNMAYNLAEDQLLTYSADRQSVLWDLSPNHELKSIPVLDQEIPGGMLILRVAYHPDGDKIAVTITHFFDEPHPMVMKVFDVNTSEQLLSFNISGEDGYLGDFKYSPDGELIATAHTNGVLQIWDSDTGELLRKLSDFGDDLLNYAADRGFHGLDFSPLCSTSPGDVCPLATAGTDGQAIIWDANTGDQIIKHMNEDALVNTAFSPDGKLLAFGNAQWNDIEKGGWVKLLDVESGEVLHMWTGIKGWVFSIGFRPDGKHLAIGTTIQDLRIFDVATGKEVHQLYPQSPIMRLEYTPDGKYLLTNTFDKTMVWDTDSGELLYVLADGTSLPFGLAISPDGSKVAVGTDMIYQYLLDVEQLAALGQERLTRTFTEDECQKYLHMDSCPAE